MRMGAATGENPEPRILGYHEKGHALAQRRNAMSEATANTNSHEASEGATRVVIKLSSEAVFSSEQIVERLLTRKIRHEGASHVRVVNGVKSQAAKSHLANRK